MIHSFIIEERERGLRLDKFLVSRLGKQSRSQVQREIKEGRWVVDGKKAAPHYAVREGQAITLVEERKPPQPLLIKEGIIVWKVIAETEDYLIIDKPAGIAVHGGPGIKEETLTDLLLKKYPEFRGVGEDPARPGIVHRLDKDVSGVMVVARNQETYYNLKKQFQERRVDKEYEALVHGTFVNDEGHIELPLARSTRKRKHGTMIALHRGGKPRTNHAVETSFHYGAGADGTQIGAENLRNYWPREAVTFFEAAQRFPRCTLLKVFPRTGRTHQIRAHLAAIGHPIVGDPLYRSSKVRRVRIEMKRPFLHAASLTFADREGKVQKYRSALPDDLAHALFVLTGKFK